MDGMNRIEDVLRELWIRLVEDKQELTLEDYDESLTKELLSRGYVRVVNGRLELTDKGREHGRRIVRLHRLTERLLSDVLAMREELYERATCNVEHAITEELESAICTLLGHPKVCPHGRLIPPGECCIKGEEEVKRVVFPLYDLNPGDEGRICYIVSEDQNVLLRLIDLGLSPGRKVKLLRKFPSYIVKVRFSQVAIDGNAAKSIYVIKL